MKVGQRIDWREMQRSRTSEHVVRLLFIAFCAFDVFMGFVVWRMHS